MWALSQTTDNLEDGLSGNIDSGKFKYRCLVTRVLLLLNVLLLKMKRLVSNVANSTLIFELVVGGSRGTLGKEKV